MPIAQQGNRETPASTGQIQDRSLRGKLQPVLGQAPVEIDVGAAAAVLEVVERGIVERLLAAGLLVGPRKCVFVRHPPEIMR